MIPITPIRQKPSYCGPTCLEMVFRHYGTKASQETLARQAHTTLEKGTLPRLMVRVAQRHGFYAKFIEDGTHALLSSWVNDRKIPVIVDWWSQDDGHYSVCVKLTSKKIWLVDPELGKVRRMDWKTFQRNWFDFEGDLLRKSADIRLRGMIIISPSELRNHSRL